MTNELGSSSQKTLSNQENPCNKAQCEGCIPRMPPQHGNTNLDMHPAPMRRSHFDDATAHLRRSPLPFGMGIHCRIHLKSSQCNPTQQRLESHVSPLTSLAPCAEEDRFSQWSPFQDRTGSDSRHPSRPKRNSWSLHWRFCQSNGRHPQQRSTSRTSPAPSGRICSLGSVQSWTPPPQWHGGSAETHRRDRPHQTKNHPGMVIGFSFDDDHPPRQ